MHAESGLPPADRPAFLTLAMWLAWLVRPDLRGDDAIDNDQAQRDHVAWWLLAGRGDYRPVWWYGPLQEAVAMELVPTSSGVALPRLLIVLRRLWRELHDRFDLADPEDCCAYLCWYRIAGPTTLAAAPALPAAAIALTQAPSTATGWHLDGQQMPRMAVAYATLHPAAGEAPLACRLTMAERRRLLAWFGANGVAAMPAPTRRPAAAEPLPDRDLERGEAEAVLDRDGFNLIGFARAEMGIGEDVRAMSAALDAVRVAHCVIDTLPQSGARLNDARLADRIVAAPRYATSVFCMSPTDTAVLYLRSGTALFTGTYRIGSWPWELPRFPAALQAITTLVHEIWAHSRYSAAALGADHGLPVRLMPPAVTVAPASAPVRVPGPGPGPVRRPGAAGPRAQFTCLYQFDPNSYFARKNPLAAIGAFQLAFPPADRRARLMLRINGWLAEWEDGAPIARAAAADRRIVLREGTLPRAAMLRLMAKADVFISPHRAEGFGRNLAEALLLGVPVLATGFSGSCDFLRPEEQISWARRDVAVDEYPFGDGQWWADPDIQDLAARLAALAAAVRAGRGASLTARRRRAAAFTRIHGVKPAGIRYRAVLAEVGRDSTRSARLPPASVRRPPPP